MRSNRTISFLVVLLAYVIALGVGYYVLQMAVGDLFMTVLMADIAATLVIFFASMITRNSSMYDPYWSVIPPFIVLFLMQQFPEGNDARQLLFLLAVSVWAIRLTLNWMRGWSGLDHEDWRYRDLAEKSGSWYWLVSFSGIHLFPTLIVFLGCLPAFTVLKNPSPLGVFDYLGCAICIAAALIQLVSDEQMRVFKKTAEKGAIMKSGLWRLSRHPNYFGEILFWFGLFVFVLPFSMDTWWTALGWVGMLILFVFVSVPMMEERSIKNKPGFEAYTKESSALFPSLKAIFSK